MNVGYLFMSLSVQVQYMKEEDDRAMTSAEL